MDRLLTFFLTERILMELNLVKEKKNGGIIAQTHLKLPDGATAPLNYFVSNSTDSKQLKEKLPCKYFNVTS